jgi:methyl-accepting chemotaxis protein
MQFPYVFKRRTTMLKNSYWHRVVIRYAALSIVLACLIACTSFIIIRSALQHSFITLTEARANQLLTEFNAFYEKKAIAIDTLASNSTFITFIRSLNYINIHNSAAANYQFDSVVELLNNTALRDSDILAVTLTLLDKDEMVYSTGDVYATQHNEPFNQLLPAKLTDSVEIIFPSYYDLHYNKSVIGFRRIIFDGDSAVGALTAHIEHSRFNAGVMPSEQSDNKLLLFDDNGHILYASEDNLVQWQTLEDIDASFTAGLPALMRLQTATSFNGTLGTQQMLFYYAYLPAQSLHAIIGFDTAPLKNDILQYTIWLSALSIGLLLIFILWAIIRNSRWEKQFHEFSEHLTSASNGLFGYTHLTSDNPSFNKLFAAYNDMLTSLETISNNISSISSNIHQYATALNEDAEVNNRAIQQISKAILTISEDAMRQVESIETLDTLARAIHIKIEGIDETFKSVETAFQSIPDLQPEELLLVQKLREDFQFLKDRNDDIVKLLKGLTDASKQNAFVSRSIKRSIDQQRDSIKSMSRAITNLYRSSLNLNNNISKFSVKINTSKKHPD